MFVKREVLSSIDGGTSFPFPNKIPIRLLIEFINLAKVMARLKLEVRGEFYFNWDTEEYILHIPYQDVHEVWVTSKETPGHFETRMLKEYGYYVQLACEIHSHHVMRAIPSSTDNANERRPNMFYVIVGRLVEEQSIPEIYVRSFTPSQIHQRHKLDNVFTDDGTTWAYNKLPLDFDVKNMIIHREEKEDD